MSEPCGICGRGIADTYVSPPAGLCSLRWPSSEMEHWRLGYERMKGAVDRALEEAAHVCDAMVIGGRAWTEGQAIAADALFAAAKNIRALTGRPQADAPKAPSEAVPEIERLKAENASLLEWKAKAMLRLIELEPVHDELAAAEQRAEAAEKEIREKVSFLKDAVVAAEKERDEQRTRADMNGDLSSQWHDKWVAAEKRATNLLGALRAAVVLCYSYGEEKPGLDCRKLPAICNGCEAEAWWRPGDGWVLWDGQSHATDCPVGRAALHDEERPPVDLMKELHTALKDRFAAVHDEERSAPQEGEGK